MKYLNLGCGSRYHKEWTNINFTRTGGNVIAHNLLDGVPFEDDSFEVVYHSHILEHFNQKDGFFFLQECFRVLKPGGIFRCAVPDLEKIIRLYLANLELAEEGDSMAKANYDWLMLEMYDQTVRNFSGGEMGKYLSQNNILNEKFVSERIGSEGDTFRKKTSPQSKSNSIKTERKSISRFLKKSTWLSFLKRQLFKKELEYIAIGKFRLGGEVHQWMYDKYSLKKLLSEIGFKNIEIKSGFESAIPDWNKYKLDSDNGIILKPDSLFIEATK